jgi:hypothetical protein
MNRVPLHQRCWNHEGREAVCQCPGCSRSFCRECVTEHEARLLCAVCLEVEFRTGRPRRSVMSGAAIATLALASLLFTWAIFFCLGEAIMSLNARLGQTAWLR